LMACTSLGLLVSCMSPDEHAVANAKELVSARLEDPESARFNHISVVREPDNGKGFFLAAVCGIVDGKNSFGAYTGGSRFVVLQTRSYGTLGTIHVEMEKPADAIVFPGAKETPFERSFWNKRCVDVAHPPMYAGNKSP